MIFAHSKIFYEYSVIHDLLTSSFETTVLILLKHVVYKVLQDGDTNPSLISFKNLLHLNYYFCILTVPRKYDIYQQRAELPSTADWSTNICISCSTPPLPLLPLSVVSITTRFPFSFKNMNKYRDFSFLII